MWSIYCLIIGVGFFVLWFLIKVGILFFEELQDQDWKKRFLTIGAVVCIILIIVGYMGVVSQTAHELEKANQNIEQTERK